MILTGEPCDIFEISHVSDRGTCHGHCGEALLWLSAWGTDPLAGCFLVHYSLKWWVPLRSTHPTASPFFKGADENSCLQAALAFSLGIDPLAGCWRVKNDFRRHNAEG